mgnify:CR=1 FL=1
MILALTPLLVPLATAVLCTLTHSSPRWQQRLSMSGSLVFLVLASGLVFQVSTHNQMTLTVGNWPLPFGIEVVVDRLGSALTLIAAFVLTICLLWQSSHADPAPKSGLLHPLMHGLVAGACAAFIAADLFNLYVWFEVALICALGLLAQGNSLKHLDATLKYFVLNLVGTLLLLTAVALLYAATGHLNFAAMGAAAAQVDVAIILPLLGLLMLAFLVKAAAFPFFAWLPASYHTLPAPVLALFSALMSKIGICALIRILSETFYPAPEVLMTVLSWVALLSMVVGVLGAAYHWDMRRILAFHSISQVGYMLLALALASRAADAAAIFFALHHSLVKAGLFLCAALIFSLTGYYDLRRIGGLYATHPGLAILFLMFSLSLVGIPPSSGFWGKYLIVRECFAQTQYLWAGVALSVGGLTFYSMLKIWKEAFWKPHPDEHCPLARPPKLIRAYTGLTLLLIAVLWIGLYPEPLLAFVNDASALFREGLR